MDSIEGAPFFRPAGDNGVEAAAIMSQAAAKHTIPAPKTHHKTSAFLDGKRMMALGINAAGTFALTLCFHPTNQATTPLQLWRVVSLKEEQELYKLACHRRVSAQPDQVDLERTRLGLVRTIDPVLRAVIDPILKEWEKIPRVESKALSQVEVIPRSKPARQFECTVTSLEAVTAAATTAKDSSLWNLWLVEVPRHAARRENQLPAYKEIAGLDWQVAEECVPVVAFSESQVVAIYDHKDSSIGLVLDCASLSRNDATRKWTASRAWMYRVPPIPEYVSYLAHLSEGGTLVWATGYTVWVTTMVGIHFGAARVFQFEPHVLITSLTVCDISRILTVGTSRGEVVSWNWETAADESLDIMLTPYEEPVLAVHRDAATQGRNMALTISAVLGRLNPGSHEFKTLEMERPTGMAAAGNCIVVANKYGKVEVYYPGRSDVPMRGLLDIPKEPKAIFQITWPGVWCNAQGEMAAQMYDGTVHYWE